MTQCLRKQTIQRFSIAECCRSEHNIVTKRESGDDNIVFFIIKTWSSCLELECVQFVQRTVYAKTTKPL